MRRWFVVPMLWMVISVGFVAPCLADDLTLYFFPSSGLNWKTPSSILQSVVMNTVTGDEYLIGHVTVEVKCSEEGGGAHFHSGMTFKDLNESRNLIFKKGSGLSILLTSLNGRMERSEEIQNYLPWDALEGDMGFLRFLIPPSTCQRLTQYYQEFQERDIGRWYGLPHRPRYGEGAGCAAYAMSYLELAGLIEPEFQKKWSDRFLVPQAWMGPPIFGERVSPWDLWRNANEWAAEDEPHVPLFFWNPDRMYAWLIKRIRLEKRIPTPGSRLTRWGTSPGWVIDRRNVSTPTDPIWLK